MSSTHRKGNYVRPRPSRHGTQHAPRHPLDIPGLARALISYCDEVGVEAATFVRNSLGSAATMALLHGDLLAARSNLTTASS